MRQCDYCGLDLRKWNLDEKRMLMCDICVQRLLAYTPLARRQRPVARQTRGREGIGMGKPWNHKKLPIKWENDE